MLLIDSLWSLIDLSLTQMSIAMFVDHNTVFRVHVIVFNLRKMRQTTRPQHTRYPSNHLTHLTHTIYKLFHKNHCIVCVYLYPVRVITQTISLILFIQLIQQESLHCIALHCIVCVYLYPVLVITQTMNWFFHSWHHSLTHASSPSLYHILSVSYCCCCSYLQSLCPSDSLCHEYPHSPACEQTNQ